MIRSSVVRISTVSIIEFLAGEFQKESGMDILNDPLAVQRLKEAAEKAKIELSTRQQTESQPAVHHGGSQAVQNI